MLSLFKTYAMKKLPLLILSLGGIAIVSLIKTATKIPKNEIVYVNISPDSVKPFKPPIRLITDKGMKEIVVR